MRAIPALFLLLTACKLLDPSTDDSRTELKAELTRRETEWTAHGIVNYDFQYRRECDCPELATALVNIEVRDKLVTRVTDESGTEIPAPPANFTWPTVDSLFTWAHGLVDDPGFTVGLAFNDTLDYPTYIIGDRPNLANDQFVHNASDLVSVQPRIVNGRLTWEKRKN